jgi:hypothetical protein
METQLRQLEAALLEDGWAIVERESSPDEWWLDEVWLLESEWTPRGRRVYLGFLVDPQAPRERTKGEHVWAVVAAAGRPTSRHHAERDVPLRPHWDREGRHTIMAQVRSLRSRVPEQAG